MLTQTLPQCVCAGTGAQTATPALIARVQGSTRSTVERGHAVSVATAL